MRQDAPLAGDRDAESLAERLQIAQLIQIQSAPGKNLVVLQRKNQGLIGLAVRVISLDDIDLPLDQKQDQQEVDLIRRESVDGGAEVLVDAFRSGMMVQKRRKQTDQVVIVQLLVHVSIPILFAA